MKLTMKLRVITTLLSGLIGLVIALGITLVFDSQYSRISLIILLCPIIPYYISKIIAANGQKTIRPIIEELYTLPPHTWRVTEEPYIPDK